MLLSYKRRYNSWHSYSRIGVAVHTVDCETLSSYNDNPERWLNISWDNSVNKNTVSNSRLNVVLKNQPGSLGKVTTIIAKNNGNISKTADFIGMERSALHRKLKILGIKGMN